MRRRDKTLARAFALLQTHEGRLDGQARRLDTIEGSGIEPRMVSLGGRLNALTEKHLGLVKDCEQLLSRQDRLEQVQYSAEEARRRLGEMVDAVRLLRERLDRAEHGFVEAARAESARLAPAPTYNVTVHNAGGGHVHIGDGS
jgi:hypothetical protein